MPHKVDIAEVYVLDRLKSLLLLVLPHSLNERLAQTLKDNRVVARQVLKEPLADLEHLLIEIRGLHPSFGLAAEVEDVPQYVHGDLLEGHFHEMRVLDVEVLEYLEGERAVVFLRGYGLEDLLEGVDDVGDDELVLLVYGVAVLLVFLAEDPTIHPLCYRDLLLLEEAQQGLNQHRPIVLSEQLRLDPEMREHEVQSGAFDGGRVFLEARDEGVDDQGVEVGIVVLRAVGVDSLLDHADALRDHQGHRVQLYLVLLLENGGVEGSLALKQPAQLAIAVFLLLELGRVVWVGL